MSEITTEPTYKQTTFGSMSFEQEAPVEETPTETPAETVPTAEVPVDTPTEAAPVEQPAEAVVEENVSNFNLSYEGQPPVEAAQTEQPTPTVYNWKEEIKKLDPKEVAKELGLNDFTLEMDEYLKKGGNATDYITKRGYDWNKISDEELIKQDLKNVYPDATSQQIERLYNKKFSQQEIDTDEDKEDGLLLMKAEARRIRDAKIQEQQTFKIPEAIIPQIKDEAYEQWKQMQETQPAMIQQLKTFYENHEATKSLYQSKRVAVSLGEGVQPFNFSIDRPEALINMFVDGGETYQKLTSTKTGEPDVAKQQLIGLFMFDPYKYSQELFNYGMQTGIRKKVVGEGQNAQRPQQKVMPPEMNGQATYGTGKFGDRARN